MALDWIQAVMSLFSYAVQEASDNIVVPIPQAIRVSFLKNYHLAMPDKSQPGQSGAYQWGTQ